MDLTVLADATRARERRYRRLALPQEEEEEEDIPEPAAPQFSVRKIVEEQGANRIGELIRFTWNEFQELFAAIEHGITQAGRGRRRKLDPLDELFVFMVYVTSGLTLDAIAVLLNLKAARVLRIVDTCLTPVTDALGSLLPARLADVHCQKVFRNFPHVFAIVDASPVFINRPILSQQQYYSGKFKRHCVKVQALVTADGQCIHLSQVFRGSSHDKAIFDQSKVVEFLTERDDHGLEQPRWIMGDLGYMGINRSGARAVIPFRRHPGQQLDEQQEQHNRTLSADRILAENFFGRWKSLFGICHGTYRGSLVHLSRIIRSTVLMTNWYVARHPLRRVDEDGAGESDEDVGVAPAILLDGP
jgi:hypothetical protein